MIHMFFDTETNGLPKNYNAPPAVDSNWPKLLQLAAVFTDETGKLLWKYSRFVKPEDFELAPGILELTGITEEQLNSGHELSRVVLDFANMLERADVVVAHNFDFDAKIMDSEALRIKDPLNTYPIVFDTMKSKEVINYVKVPGKRFGSYKYPNLTALHTKLFGKGFEGAHNALSDASALKDCYFELLRLGVIKAAV